jgi:hypothetical protein
MLREGRGEEPLFQLMHSMQYGCLKAQSSGTEQPSGEFFHDGRGRARLTSTSSPRMIYFGASLPAE